MQVIDMIFIRPEIELCYLGRERECFEVTEDWQSAKANGKSRNNTFSHVNGPLSSFGVTNYLIGHDDGDSSNESEEDEAMNDHETGDDDDDNEDVESDYDGNVVGMTQAPIVDHAPNGGADIVMPEVIASSDDSPQVYTAPKQRKLASRRIEFYDEKVSVFKARHMTL